MNTLAETITKEWTVNRTEIFHEIHEERAAQDAKYGGAENDDKNSNVDWFMHITKHMYRAVSRGAKGIYRKQLIRVAALALAAIESHDRENKG